jgi:hypothetical protein
MHVFKPKRWGFQSLGKDRGDDCFRSVDSVPERAEEDRAGDALESGDGSGQLLAGVRADGSGTGISANQRPCADGETTGCAAPPRRKGQRVKGPGERKATGG